MKDSKDIFDLFKDNEDKLNQPPSDRAWDRLEGRLDNHKQNNQAPQRAPRLIRKWLSMTGVLLVLVLAISGLSNLFQNKSTATAMNQSPASPQLVLEEIGLYSDQSNTREDIDLYRTQLNRLNTNPILEGDPSKELRVQQSVFINIKEENTRKLLAENTNQNPRKFSTKKKAAKSNESAKASVGDLVTKDKKEMVATAPTASAMSTTEKIDEVNAHFPEEKTTDINADMAVMEEIIVASAPATMMEESSVEIHANGNSSSINQLDISSLNWLLGKWDSPLYNNNNTNAARAKIADTKATTQSFEEWTQTNTTTISGRGFILDKGNKTPIESMQIKQVGSELFYILSIGKQAPLQYKLKSYTPEKVIFENNELPFPNQVILQRSIDGRSFSTIFQNDTALQLDEGMRKYFEQRNEINTEQIKRVMKKRN